MGKFLNGELASGYVWESVKFGDFALHYGWPRWMCWIRLGVKSFFARMRLRKDLDAFEILIGGRIVAFSDSVPESAFGLSELTPAPCRAAPIPGNSRCNGEQKVDRLR